ncbi:retrovirus-related pol polyprotein from transposon TNT 1-94 [Tanacetum coccineum]
METQKPLLKDEDGEEVDVYLYRSMIGSLMYLTSSRPDIMFAVCACARYQVDLKMSHLYVVKRIFRYLKGQPKLSLWYPKDSPFDLVAYTNSDYAGASLDRKSTTGCQFLGSRLISWQCKKKQTVVANSTTEAEYVAASSCCGQVYWNHINCLIMELNGSSEIKKDERGIVIKNKARLVAQGYTQEKGIDYDEVFAPISRIKAIRLFLAYASFKDFVVYQMDVKSAFLYGKIEKEVYVCQPYGFDDSDFPDRVYKVENALYGLHQAPRACDVKTASTPMETHKPLLKDADGEDVDKHMYRSMIGSLMYLTSSRPDIMFVTKSAKSKGFEQMVDFLNASSIRYALTVNPTIYTSYIEQFWATAKVKTVNGEQQLQALVDGKKIIIIEAPVRRDLQVEDADGDDCLPNAIIFEQLTLMGKQKSRRPKEKHIEIPQSSVPSDPTNVADEAVIKEPSMQLKELMDFCTKLQQRVLDLENTKSAQAQEITSLKKRVKKLENKGGSRTHKLKRLYSVGRSRRAVNVHRDEDMFGVNDLEGDEVVVESEVADKDVNLSVDEVTLAQALTALKSAKIKDKGKSKMVEEEPMKKMSKKEILKLDKELAFKLQAKEDEEERLAREKA